MDVTTVWAPSSRLACESAPVCDEPARTTSHRCAPLRHRYRDGNGEEREMAKRKRKQDGPTGTERQEAIVELIRAVPEGFVTTYGDLCPEAARLPAPVLATTTQKP